MKNVSIYAGFIMTAERANGDIEVSSGDSLFYHGLDDLQATMIQDTLQAEFGDDFDALRKKIRPRMVELGYASVLSKGDTDVAEVEAAKGLAKGKAKKA